ncbi:LexA family transcriptional regulator [Altericroceibacterium spongiae]|uniref:LexA family transcriptional regulator n=2 Tax=Altericroceibacterium spongiae TaxID=2320269 RepID=A0A420EKQ6_9SPHN|nr:LexA family transcriptional regulator [Altericroceibacterium spongiae]RKF21277.1 LexA family transcriptional regulator [Altericroceibacterium spongiae]
MASGRAQTGDPRERLAELAQEAGVSLASLSRMIGRNASYLQQYITKGSPRRLDEADREKLAEFFGVPESELGGRREISYDIPVSRRKADWVEVPRLSLSASAGPGELPAEEVPFDTFRFSRRWLRQQGFEPAKLSAIRVVGDSMEPLLRDGDEVLVDHSPSNFREGVHVVRIGDALHVKRVQAGPPGRVVLISENHAYAPFEVGLEDIELIGRVVWKSGRL